MQTLRDAERRRHWWRSLALTRGALALVAVGQLVVTIPPLLFGTDHDAPMHVAHELGAFDMALAVGFLVAVFRPSRAPGMRTLVGCAALLLVATAAIDLLTGRTTASDELPHLLAVAGWLLLRRIAVLAPPNADDHALTLGASARYARRILRRSARDDESIRATLVGPDGGYPAAQADGRASGRGRATAQTRGRGWMSASARGVRIVRSPRAPGGLDARRCGASSRLPPLHPCWPERWRRRSRAPTVIPRATCCFRRRAFVPADAGFSTQQQASLSSLLKASAEAGLPDSGRDRPRSVRPRLRHAAVGQAAHLRASSWASSSRSCSRARCWW